ncbi:MAG: isochorismatase family protein [Burkholderiaceae bacterium]|nr:isochorismatase family protein [Burkholderiaceae bacterium]
MKSCLLVIDVQESFRHRPYFSEAALPAYLAAQNALIAGCVAAGVPVVRVLHSDGPEVAGNPFALASGHVRPLDGLVDFDAAATFVKHRHSSLVGTGLDVWLTQHGVQRLIVSGIRTEQCCETTTRHASDLGWQVDFVLEATLTFDMTQPDGKVLPAADIAMRTATVLQDRFACVCTVAQALARAEEGAGAAA